MYYGVWLTKRQIYFIYVKLGLLKSDVLSGFDVLRGTYYRGFTVIEKVGGDTRKYLLTSLSAQIYHLIKRPSCYSFLTQPELGNFHFLFVFFFKSWLTMLKYDINGYVYMKGYENGVCHTENLWNKKWTMWWRLTQNRKNYAFRLCHFPTINFYFSFSFTIKKKLLVAASALERERVCATRQLFYHQARCPSRPSHWLWCTNVIQDFTVFLSLRT